MTSSKETGLNTRTHAPNGAGPYVRRSKRPLLAHRTHCKCSIDTTTPESQSHYGNRSAIRSDVL